MMGCLFSLVQFVPETWADDRLTIGIIAIDEDNSAGTCAFVQDWHRVRCFADGDTSFLRSFVKSIQSRIGPENSLTPPTLTIEQLREMAAEYGNAIQLSEPSCADATAREWVHDFGPMFVRDLDRSAKKTERVTQKGVAGNTRRILRRLLSEKYHLPTAERVVHEAEIPGPHDTTRTIDAAIRNGRIHFGSIATSFDHDEDYTQRQIDSVIARVQDIRTTLPETTLMVVTDPFSTEAISQKARTRLENQLIGRCLDVNVHVARLDERPKIEAKVAEVLTPDVVKALAAD